MLMMDPYGLMDAPQPTKLLVNSSSSNNTVQTMETDDSEEATLPSIMGAATNSSLEDNDLHNQEEEECFFDPYTTNTLSTDEDDLDHKTQAETIVHGNRVEDVLYSIPQITTTTTSSLNQSNMDNATVASCSTSSTTRLEQAAQDASFYLQEEFFDSKSELPLFDKKDETAARMETAAKDVSFYLEQEFHDAQDGIVLLESSSNHDKKDASPLPTPVTEQEQFQDCQDDDSIDHDSIPPSSPSSPQDSSSCSPQASATDISFYLQLTQDGKIIDLEREECPSPIPHKIASFSKRIDMDGAIRHKTVFFDNSMNKEELPHHETMVEELHSLESSCSSESSMMSEQDEEKEEEVAVPLHAPSTLAAPECPPTETTEAEADHSIIGPVSLDKYVPPKTITTIVFQKEQSISENRRQLSSQRIDMAGILQPTEIYGPILLNNTTKDTTTATTTTTPSTSSIGSSSSSSNPQQVQQELEEEEAFTPETLALTLKKEFDEHSSHPNNSTQQVTEQVGCGCGSWFLFRRR